MRVTVTGREKDASYTPRGNYTVRRAVVLEADDVAMSLTYGTAVFTRPTAGQSAPHRLPSAERRRGAGSEAILPTRPSTGGAISLSRAATAQSGLSARDRSPRR